MTTIGLVSIEVTTVLVLAAASIDGQRGVVPNLLTYPASAVLLLCAMADGRVLQSLTGAVAVASPLTLLYFITRRRGMGLGDVKLAVCIGAGIGPSAGLLALGAAFVSGGVAAAALLGTRRCRVGEKIPFAPFLALGTVTAGVFYPALRP